MQHRLLANRQLVLVHRLEELLATMPFADLLRYPESFRFERCEPWPAVVDLVRERTGAAGLGSH